MKKYLIFFVIFVTSFIFRKFSVKRKKKLKICDFNVPIIIRRMINKPIHEFSFFHFEILKECNDDKGYLFKPIIPYFGALPKRRKGTRYG